MNAAATKSPRRIETDFMKAVAVLIARLARNSPLRPAEANLIKVEVGMARADVMKDSRNRSSNAIVESFR